MTRKLIRFLREPPAAPLADERIALELPGLPPPVFAAVEVLWFDGDVPERSGELEVVVDEHLLRGDARSGPFTMLSFGRRNPALTRAEFVERWRKEAGSLGGDRIPDDLRGLGYVQNVPLGDDPPLDAINEVWFADLDTLRRRAEWFAARPIPADLMSPTECWSLYVRDSDD